MSPSLLDSVLRRLPRQADPKVLVGFETSDDAGVYQLDGEVALVQTVDFLTPIVDDAYSYGQIAAANALSDVYAMGGRPVSALSVVAFPGSGSPELLEEILRGGLAKMQEAECSVIGGHSIRDEELKFGYAVTGVVNPKRIWRNVGARAGDALILTKALGTGVIATALKQEHCSAAVLESSVRSMLQLNREAAEKLRELETLAGADSVHAVTDVTGFGFLGHAREMALGSGVSFRVDSERIPVLPGALEAAKEGFLAGGLKNNREFLEGCVSFTGEVSEAMRRMLYDPQTSGGLLVAVSANAAEKALELSGRTDTPGERIGEVREKGAALIEVVK